MLTSSFPLIDQKVNGNTWLFQDKLFWIIGSSMGGTLLCMLFYKTSSRAYRDKMDAFFKRIRTPVDFEKEVKVNRDRFQLNIMGATAILGGCLLSLLLLVPNSPGGRLGILFLAGFVATMGFLLRRAAK